MVARIGWFLLLVVVVVADVIAAYTNTDSLTSTFRRSVAETNWRWPAMFVVALLVAHLFLPPSLRRYDPLDRLYYKLNPAAEPPPPGVGPVPEFTPETLPPETVPSDTVPPAPEDGTPPPSPG